MKSLRMLLSALTASLLLALASGCMSTGGMPAADHPASGGVSWGSGGGSGGSGGY